jgi:hypothetical protein
MWVEAPVLTIYSGKVDLRLDTFRLVRKTFSLSLLLRALSLKLLYAFTVICALPFKAN